MQNTQNDFYPAPFAIDKATVTRIMWNTKGCLALKGDMNRKLLTHSMILSCQ